MARKTRYSTASKDGMSFIANRWVFTGDEGYEVRPDGNGTDTYSVWSYHAAGGSPTYGGLNMSEDDAHALAARLARTTPHPKV